MHRRAAIAMGVEREWAYVPARLDDCPVCGEKIKQGVAVCKHCRAILDEDKAAKHGLHRENAEFRTVVVKGGSTPANGTNRAAVQAVSSPSNHPSGNSRR